MLERFSRYAAKHAHGNKRVLAVAECLHTLIHGPPTNTYEVLQLIYLFFMFGEHIDRFQVRSLGNLDRTVYPYFLPRPGRPPIFGSGNPRIFRLLSDAVGFDQQLLGTSVLFRRHQTRRRQRNQRTFLLDPGTFTISWIFQRRSCN